MEKGKIIIYAGKMNNIKYSKIKNKYPNSKIIGLCYDFNELKSFEYNIKNHIKFDITNKHPFNNNSIDMYISEHVFEHISFEKLNNILTDIYRILKKNGILLISLPEYRNIQHLNRTFKFNKDLLNTKESKNAKWPINSSFKFNLDIINNTTKINNKKFTNGEKITIDDIKNSNGIYTVNNKIIIDLLGGMPNNGGHIWFPIIENVKELINNSLFNKENVKYLHYIDYDNTNIIKNINYDFLSRLPENDIRYNGQPLSLIVECIK